MSIAAFQDAFANTLLAPELNADAIAAIPRLGNSEITSKQFAIYRELTLGHLRSILAEVHPTVAKVMAAEDFQRLGDAFFLKHPPHSVNPVLITEMFGAFIEKVLDEDTAALPQQNYLADLVTLDYGCYQAKHAVDAIAVHSRIFTELTPELLSVRRIQLHPACFWLSSPYAIYDIWQHHHAHHRALDLNVQRPQEVVIVRPQIQVEVHRVDVGLVKTLDALDEGQTINDALMQGSIADPSFNAVAAMQFLIQNDLIVSLY